MLDNIGWILTAAVWFLFVYKLERRRLRRRDRWMWITRPGECVYFIQRRDGGPIKIGYTTNLNNRIKSLQTASPVSLVILGTIDGNMQLEKNLHYRFRRYRLAGEWFQEDAPGLKELARGS